MTEEFSHPAAAAGIENLSIPIVVTENVMTTEQPENSRKRSVESGQQSDRDDYQEQQNMTLRKRQRVAPSGINEEEEESAEADSHHSSHIPHMVIEQSPEELQAEESLESGYKTGPWVYEEDERLIQAVGMYKKPDGNVNWTDVARFISDRSQKQCYVRWNTLLKYRGMGTRRGAWTPEEDHRLAEAVARHERKGGGIFWGKVSEEMGGDRTYQQCLKRWKQVLQHVGSGTRTGAWTDEEDARLVEAMSLYDGQGKGGGVDWTKVSEYLGGMRAPTQCYKRWHDALKQRRKSLLGEDWSPEEDYLVIQAVSLYAGEGLGGGVDWNAVSDHLGNSKSSKQCNKRWNRVLKIKDGVEGRIRTDPWEPEEERLLYLGVETCRIPAEGEAPVAYDPQDVSVNNSEQQPSDTNSLYQVHQDLQEQLYQQPPQESPGTQYSDLPSGQHVSFHHLYPAQTDLAPGEIHLKSVDWNRVSNEFLQGHRTARQCEKRFEGLQRQRIRDSQYGDSFEAPRESLGGENQDDSDERRLSVSSMGSARSTLDDRRASIGSAGSYYRNHRGRAVKTGPWVAEEDERLIEAVALYEGQGRGGAVDWGKVCDYMGGERTYDQCRVRWNGVLKVFKNRGTVVKTGPWAKIEVIPIPSSSTYPNQDEKLVEAVGVYEGQGKGGGVDWSKVSEYLHGERTPNQCHTRWNSVLKHRGLAMKTSPWTDLEDIKLTEAVGMFDGVGRGGTVDWSKVSEHMGGERSSYQHRMRWHSVLKHRVAGSASRPVGKKEAAMEPWNTSEIQILLNAVESSAKVNPLENSDITEDGEYSLHQSQHEGIMHSHESDSSSQIKDITLDAFDIPGPVAAASQGGAMLAHTIDWTSVSNRVSEEYAMLGGLGPKRTPLQCLHMWRQVMNSRMRMPATTTASDIGTVDIDDARMMPGNSFALSRNSPWTDMEDEKLTEAVGVYDGQGRGGGVDWAKVCEFMGSVRTYNQCRHRWHNVIKHRGMNPEDMTGRLSTGGDEMYQGYNSQDQEWANPLHANIQHQLLEQQEQRHQQEVEEDPNLQYLQKYDV